MITRSLPRPRSGWWDAYRKLPEPARKSLIRLRHGHIWSMIPADSHIVLIHIPKTGGTTLGTVLYGRAVNHYPAWVWRDANPERFHACECVTVLREPLTRLVSAIQHCLNGARASSNDLALGAWLSSRNASVDDMAMDLLEVMEKAEGIERHLLLRPYSFWLNGALESDKLHCFRLREKQRSSDTMRLNASSHPSSSLAISQRTRAYARKVLAGDYEIYEKPSHADIGDVMQIPALLAKAS